MNPAAKPKSVTELRAGAQTAADEAAPLIDALPPLAALRQPFPPSQVGKLPKGGVDLDYVGHGAVTARLLDVDPGWNWEPVAYDQHGLPQFTYDANGNPIALWIRLTVAGVTRLGCGTCKANQFDAEKVLIGDAIRNAAMRFGVALDLWIKGHAEDDEQQTNTDSRTGPSRNIGWGKDEARAFVLETLCEDDKVKATAAWAAIGRTPWTPDALTAAFEAWVNENPAEDGGPVSEEATEPGPPDQEALL